MTEVHRGGRLIGQNGKGVLDLLQHLGHALWSAQMLEEGVAQYLVIVHEVPLGRAVKEAEAAFDAAEKRSLGSLLTRIRKYDTPESLVTELDEFVQERNWLVHRIHREYWGTARNQEVGVHLIQRLDGIADDAIRIANLFVEEVERLLLARGLTHEFLEQKQREILADVRAGQSTVGRRGFRE